jgi:hypothetical protein
MCTFAVIIELMLRFGCKTLLFLGCLLIGVGSINGQELNCKVTVNTQQITGTDKVIYEKFRAAVQNYMNTTRFTNLQLKDKEKIECSLQFYFKKKDGNTHSCDFQIQSSRPIYGSNYNTTLLNYKQELDFDFQENQAITFNPNSINDNLTASLDFWAYVILGLDFDSFSKLGGTPYFQRAQDISSMAQGSFGDNWKAQQDKNNWGWINALTTENQQDMRILSYQYHRLGLDLMYENTVRGRYNILQALSNLKSVKQIKPGSPLLANFIEIKADELIGIFSEATPKDKNSAMATLTTVYPASSNKLSVILIQ